MAGDAVGYGNPPRSTRWTADVSGNPGGRPKGRHKGIPHEALLGRLATIHEGGRERHVTAAEAFLLQLAHKGLQGDSAAARDLLAAIKDVRASRPLGDSYDPLRIVYRGFGVDNGVLQALGIAIKTDPLDSEKVRCWLFPWIVEAALARFGSRRLSKEEQREVWGATQTPNRVRWPDWWTERRGPDTPDVARKRPSDSDL